MSSRTAIYEAALSGDDRLDTLRAVVADLVNEQGVDRAEVQAELEDWRQQLRAQGRDDDEDIVLEVLDFLTGWSTRT